MLGGWVSYWMIPVFSAVVWLAMLLAMILHWVTKGKPIYPSMQDGQTVAYISDVGAFEFKPLFITMGTISVVTFTLSFVLEQFLRTQGRLTKNTRGQRILAWLSILCAVVGAAGLILLTIFDTEHHHVLHDTFLALFIGGYVISAVFTCAEYQRLGIRNRQEGILRASFWLKLVFILLEVALAIAFGVLNRTKKWNDAAIVEWVIALVYTFYVASYAVDFRPATRSKDRGHHHHDELAHDQIAMSHERASPGVAHDDAADRYQQPVSAHYPSGTTASGGVINGHSNGYANGARKEMSYV